jgi:hypothetical protein
MPATSRPRADLRRMQHLYDWPTDKVIEDLMTEITELLALDYLKTVEIGFERNGEVQRPFRFLLPGRQAAGGLSLRSGWFAGGTTRRRGSPPAPSAHGWPPGASQRTAAAGSSSIATNSTPRWATHGRPYASYPTRRHELMSPLARPPFQPSGLGRRMRRLRVEVLAQALR